MFVEFTVGNFRSFQKKVTLSLEAAAITSKEKTVDENNLISIGKDSSLLTSAVIYGANASGKSNLIRAFAFMRSFIINSSRESQADDPIKVEPFRLNHDTEKEPSFFELVFLIGGQKYRYGFEVSSEKVEREWLYTTFTTREAVLFTRKYSDIKTNSRSFREGRGLIEKTRPNALFLSVAAQFNGEISMKILKYFRQIGLISGLDDSSYRSFTLRTFSDNPNFREKIKNFVLSLDTGIDHLQVERREPGKVFIPSEIHEELKDTFIDLSVIGYKTIATHLQYDSKGQTVGEVDFDLENDESEGTKKLFYLSGPMIDILNKGQVLIIDEMEARMHPLITCAMIRLFNTLETNPNRAQLIFTTHDTNLLDRNLFRRDQVWFTEKDSYGATHLYSLVEFKPRNDESYERNYLRGKYGAVPYLGDLSNIIQPETNLTEAPNYVSSES